MAFIWWCILILNVIGYGIKIANASDGYNNDVTPTTVIAEIISLASVIFLMVTSYHYIHQ